jgi:hypothetical protein
MHLSRIETDNPAVIIFFIRSKKQLQKSLANEIAESVKSCNLHQKGRIL